MNERFQNNSKCCELIEYGDLNDVQKKQAADIFLEGFGHMMTFTKDKELLGSLFYEIMNPTLFICYVEDGEVLGILGLATNKERPLKFDSDICVRLFGKMKGKIISKQMNAIFQKQAVKADKDLYIDVLATAGKARGKGVATALLDYAFALKGFECCYIEVFSKNEPAKSLYQKMGFEVYKEEKFSFLTLAVSNFGYPIMMKKELGQ